VLGLGACGGGSSGSPGPAAGGDGAAAPAATGSAAAGSAAPAGFASSAGSSTGTPVRARNLQVDDTVRRQLVVAWIDGHDDPSLTLADVASTRPGSVYYARETATGTEWAVADFEPSASALAKDKRLGGATGDPLISFQDGPWVFTRRPAGSWKLVGDNGGQLCASRVPPAVIAVWNIHQEPC
jgi:hypothetical protein